jgi:hypothetical protein
MRILMRIFMVEGDWEYIWKKMPGNMTAWTDEVQEFRYRQAGTGNEHGWVNDANIRVDFSKVTTYEKWIARVNFLKSNVMVAVSYWFQHSDSLSVRIYKWKLLVE